MYKAAVARAADELVSNAVEHGLYKRRRGRILVQVVARRNAGVEVSVSDDGWGFDGGQVVDGNGFHLLRQLGVLRLGKPPEPFVSEVAITVGRQAPGERQILSSDRPARRYVG